MCGHNSSSKIVSVNVLSEQPPLFFGGFPPDCGTWLLDVLPVRNEYE